ncbi:hypothetical protein LY474_40505 [Myxococcus stipitatus]|uniref:hypothetical protein n=1 Tax=Myxococcus stipitatus TaxID=83455 RepID=UPI001F327493|nr:hypothetical protein [Myxococcus stipitatus]MCE9674090.1 hypothetical protein [Myxococcus stipitatus]
MAIYVKEVLCKGPDVPVSAGGRGRGFRVEMSGAYPNARYPVTVRLYRDEHETYAAHTLYDRRARFPAEGFSRIEILGALNVTWRVTVYELAADWDESPPELYETYVDSDPNGGDVLKAMMTMMPMYDGGGASANGTRILGCTLSGVPRLAKAPDGISAPLALDAGGRLRVVDEVAAVVIASGTYTAADPIPAVATLTPTSHDVSAYRNLWLRIGSVTLSGGTTPTVAPAIDSRTSADASINSFAGAAVPSGGSAEVQTGAGLVHSSGNVRAYGVRVLRVRPSLVIAGSPTAASVVWELVASR